MKKGYIAVLSLSLVLLMTTIVFGDESDNGLSSEGKSILFRGIPWYSSLTEAEKTLFSEGAERGGIIIEGENTIWRLSALDALQPVYASDSIEKGGCRRLYSNITVAGYSPDEVVACYVYPIEDGKIIESEDKAQLYLGWYELWADENADFQAVNDDLVRKISSIYGEGVEEDEVDGLSKTVTWKDTDQNQIRLLNIDNTYIVLSYMAGDADERLDEIKEIRDREANEKKEELKNKDHDFFDNLVEGL